MREASSRSRASKTSSDDTNRVTRKQPATLPHPPSLANFARNDVTMSGATETARGRVHGVVFQKNIKSPAHGVHVTNNHSHDLLRRATQKVMLSR